MNVNAASAGQPGLDAAPALLPLPPTAAPLPRLLEDSVAGFLVGFSAPAIHAALHLANDPALVNALIQQAGASLAHRDTPGALHTINELFRKQPDADVRILNDLALASIHPEVRDLLRHLTLEAKIDAQNTLATATHLIGAKGNLPEPQAALALANQFLETGQYANYIRAAELGRLVIGWHLAPETKISEARDQKISRAVNRIAALWRRAPVLVLLVAWLLLGVIVIPLDPELWGVGFLAVVALQFLLTIRNRPGRR